MSTLPSAHPSPGTNPPGATGRPALAYVAALAVGAPVGGVLWLEGAYFGFGLTGGDLSAAGEVVLALAAFGAAVLWPLYRTVRPAEVVLRGCRLGVVAALLLPLVALAVLWMWEAASGRPDLGMGGMILYSAPYVSLGLALVLLLLFGLGSHVASRRLGRGVDGEPVGGGR